MLNKIVLDLETQRDFAEVGGRNKHHLLRVSVAGIYSYQADKYSSYLESELLKLGEVLAEADLVIGFNIRQFDYEVLQPYLNFPLAELPTLDILEEVEKLAGHRIGLESIAQPTLGVGKTSTGLEAIALWRAGRLDELNKYCLKDVEITKQIYDYGLKNKKLLYRDFFEVREMPVDFPEPVVRENKVRQTSLF